MKRLITFNNHSLLSIGFNKYTYQSVQGLSKWAYAAATATAEVFEASEKPVPSKVQII